MTRVLVDWGAVAPLDPLAVLEALILAPQSLRRGPGALVRACGSREREALGSLTSDALAAARVPGWVFGQEPRRARRGRMRTLSDVARSGR